jgi:hypothetical protein
MYVGHVMQDTQQTGASGTMDNFDEWDSTWELTESAYALLELIEGLQQDADV